MIVFQQDSLLLNGEIRIYLCSSELVFPTVSRDFHFPYRLHLYYYFFSTSPSGHLRHRQGGGELHPCTAKTTGVGFSEPVGPGSPKGRGTKEELCVEEVALSVIAKKGQEKLGEGTGLFRAAVLIF